MVIESQLIPNIFSIFIHVDAVNILGIIFVRNIDDSALITHELIHSKQYVETLWIGFFVIYLIDFCHGVWVYEDFGTAYSRIRFEQEANYYHFSENYLNDRPRYNWIKFNVR